MRKFSETESLVIAALTSLGVYVGEDPDSSEYYVLECRKDGRYSELFYSDIDSLYQSSEDSIMQFCTNFTKNI